MFDLYFESWQLVMLSFVSKQFRLAVNMVMVKKIEKCTGIVKVKAYRGHCAHCLGPRGRWTMPKKLIGGPISEAYYHRLCTRDFDALFRGKFLPCQYTTVTKKKRELFHKFGLIEWVCFPEKRYHTNQIRLIENDGNLFNQNELKRRLMDLLKKGDERYYLKPSIYALALPEDNDPVEYLAIPDTPPHSPINYEPVKKKRRT